MDRLIAQIYKSYMDWISENEEEEIKELAKEFGLEYKEKKLKNAKKPEFGDIFLFYYKGKPVYYLFVEKENHLNQVAKVSEFWRLGNQNDFFFKLNNEPFIIETWNKFYLTDEEIENSKYIGSLSEEDKKMLKDFFEGKISELPEGKRGLTVPEGDYDFFQNKFHKQEALLVKDLALRVFDLMEDIPAIELAPERLQQQPLAASEGKKTYRSDEFVLRYEPEAHAIEMIIVDDSVIGKKGYVEILGDKYRFEKLPETILIFLPEKQKSVNIDYIGKNIHIRES